MYNLFAMFVQRKVDETEASRQQYEESRDKLKARIHGLNSVELKVHQNSLCDDEHMVMGGGGGGD